MRQIWLILILTFTMTSCVTVALLPPRNPASTSVYSQFAGLSSVVTLNSGTTADLKFITGFEQEIWILGEQIILKRNQNSWIPVEIPGCPKHDYQSLAVLGEDDVRISCTLENGKSGSAKWDGKLWGYEQSRETQVAQTQWQSSPKDIWTVSDKGTVAHSDGTLVETRSLSSAPLTAIHGVKIASFENIWVIGNGGVILFFDGVFWQDIASRTKEKLSSVWVDPSANAWIVGDNGVILRSAD